MHAAGDETERNFCSVRGSPIRQQLRAGARGLVDVWLLASMTAAARLVYGGEDVPEMAETARVKPGPGGVQSRTMTPAAPSAAGGPDSA